ncbi:hypothetical protein, partial [Streptomyces massasporeus]|uniref:hypothetical protein n=1 Tax=Streptomyces massasporeus TaxID=67324 RepID=UPI0033EE4A06
GGRFTEDGEVIAGQGGRFTEDGEVIAGQGGRFAVRRAAAAGRLPPRQVKGFAKRSGMRPP